LHQKNNFIWRKKQVCAILTTHKVISLETNIYSAETEKLAWATASDVQVQDEVDKLTKDFIKAVVNKMLSDKVF
jgi:hypothetical protein